MKKIFVVFLLSSAMMLASCSTAAYFKTPEGTKLVLDHREVTPDDDGFVKTRPFFWNNIAGIRYELMKDGQAVKEGKLKARFRVASIFWPPYAIIYWPVGFGKIDYDLTEEKPAN